MRAWAVGGWVGWWGWGGVGERQGAQGSGGSEARGVAHLWVQACRETWDDARCCRPSAPCTSCCACCSLRLPATCTVPHLQALNGRLVQQPTVGANLLGVGVGVGIRRAGC